MMSGLRSFLGAAATLLGVSWILKFWVCVAINQWITALSTFKASDKSDEEGLCSSSQTRPRATRLARFWTIVTISLVGLLRLTRPQIPYNHMSGAIPFTFIQALGSRPIESHRTGDQAFPLPDLLGEEYWEGPHDHFRGWTPGRQTDNSANPAWASGRLPQGFDRWSKGATFSETEDSSPMGNNSSQRIVYSPVEDPLRITNLDRELLGPVARALKDHKVPITHVVLVLMESARKDIFPFKAGSHLHNEILSSYKTKDPEVLKEASIKLSNLTPNAVKITGEESGFSTSPNASTNPGNRWNDTAEPGMGGINVNGILTGSSLSFKSAIMNYCGAGPLPVNFMEEANSENYQPCIMQILELFNTLKEDSKEKSPHSSSSGLESIHDRQWSSVFLQSITGLYDDQDVLNRRMGFQEAIYREDIDHLGAKHYHRGMEEINYFGYVQLLTRYQNGDD